MNRWSKIMLLSIFSLIMTTISAQNVDHLDGITKLLRTNDKFYVVISVIVTIFIGFFIYLLLTEKKLKKLEKEFKENLDSNK